ncbi:MAG: c-type cytochrome [Acidobacteriota bacterium]
MREPSSSLDRLWFWFALASGVFLAVLAISPFKDYFREYRAEQAAYRRLRLERAGTRKELAAARAIQTGIRQIWIPGWGNRVDRCVTCHLGVDQAGMDAAPEPFRSHPRTPHTPGDLDTFGCVSCHRGQGRATTRAEAHGKVPDWDSPLLPLAYTEASCGRCHLADTVPEASLLSEGRRLMEEAGCFGCHALAGHESWTRQGPDLDGLREKTSPGWIRAWLRDPERLQPGARMPSFHLGEDEIESLTAFLWAQEAPQAAALEGVPEPPDEGDFKRGRTIFRESRCISCHTVEGRGNGSAAELGGIGSKVNRNWLKTFLANPHSSQPDTKMPRYDFTPQDLADLSRYMMEEFIDPEAPDPGPELRPSRKMVLAGRKLYRSYGCAGCHRIKGLEESTTLVGPDLNGIGDKPVAFLDFGKRTDLRRTLPDWLVAKIKEPRSFHPGLKMPVYRFTDEQIGALVTALLSVGRKPVPEPYRMPAPAEGSYRPPGRFGRLVSRYRCLSCHRIQDRGGDISRAPLTLEGSRVRKDWLEKYLLVPATIRPLLTDRMIHLRLPPEEAGFLAEFMENVYVDDDIPGEIFPDGPPPDQVERGRRLYFERYGCQSCHMVASKGGYYGPLLDGLGERLKSGWIAWWLQGPQRWGPDIRCPDFGLDARDARDLAAYIVSISRHRDQLGSDS